MAPWSDKLMRGVAGMCPSTHDDPSELLIHAYLDGELDPVNALAVTQRLSESRPLAAEAERIRMLQQRLNALPRERAPESLRARIASSVGTARPRNQRPSWRALAASIVVTAMISSSSAWLIVGSQQANLTEDVLVSDHIRSLMAREPVDVASSDRHTVKPWFNGKVVDSPRVVDLTKDDFPLVGGRVDVVGRTPVSTLVYRHAKHLISLTAVPTNSGVREGKERNSMDGYNIVRWEEGGVSYWAISDLASKELQEFMRLFRSSQSEL
jgi:anti-sigma factor RsiW